MFNLLDRFKNNQTFNTDIEKYSELLQWLLWNGYQYLMDFEKPQLWNDYYYQYQVNLGEPI
jgi:hypothetical protein